MNILPPAQYQAAICERFARIETRLRTLFPDARIEHVGASSIPGAHSKGDLDICLVVARTALEPTVIRLCTLGYEVKPDTLRTDSLCMLESCSPLDEHAVQVVAAGSRFETVFIAFRDRLRADPALLEQYNQLKMEAAHLGPEGYRAAKAGFIEACLKHIEREH